jgi:hypothetical protein
MIYDNEEYDVEETDNATKGMAYTFLGVIVAVLLVIGGIIYLLKQLPE